MTEPRIRWEPNGRDTGWCGFVGTMKPWAFQIWHAGTPGNPWRLDSALLGQFGYHVDHPDPDALKRHAERWLAGFVSSLGAVFPDGPTMAALARRADLLSDRPDPTALSEETLVRLMLEAAAPILAEAWGVARRKPGTTRDPRAGITCRRCGAQPGQQCVTSTGTRAPMVHAERRNDSRRTEGQAVGLEQEGMYMDRFPPRR